MISQVAWFSLLGRETSNIRVELSVRLTSLYPHPTRGWVAPSVNRSNSNQDGLTKVPSRSLGIVCIAIDFVDA